MWFTNLRQKFTAQSNTKKITENRLIQVLLSKIQKARTHLTVRMPVNGEVQEFASFLLRIDKQLNDPRLVFDELFPTTGNKFCKVGKSLNIHVESNGVIIDFSVIITHIENEDGAALYYCDYPEKISHKQQRKAYRVGIRNRLDFPVMLMSDNRSPIKGVLGDLSNNGMRVDITQNFQPPLQTGETFQNCYITLDNGETIQCAAQIKHIASNRMEQRKSIGLQITSYIKNGERIISKLVIELQTRGKR